MSAKGYLKVILSEGGKKTCIGVHRAVCLAFHGLPPTSGCDAAHFDGSRTNNRPENLRWADRRGNMADQYRHGTRVAGERTGNAKLTAELVRTIRGEPGLHRELAAKYGIGRTAISRIKNGRRWGHVA